MFPFFPNNTSISTWLFLKNSVIQDDELHNLPQIFCWAMKRVDLRYHMMEYGKPFFTRSIRILFGDTNVLKFQNSNHTYHS